MGCDFVKIVHVFIMFTYFNPRTRMGCDRAICSRLSPTTNFNPRTRMGCDMVLTAIMLVSMDFNPRTRMGCDVGDGLALANNKIISIHAPVWGATWQAKSCRQLSAISIHAPVWGATRQTYLTTLPRLFQSTHPYGVRLEHRKYHLTVL